MLHKASSQLMCAGTPHAAQMQHLCRLLQCGRLCNSKQHACSWQRCWAISSQANTQYHPAECDACLLTLQTVQDQAVEDPLYLLDLGAVRRLYQAWVDLMPRVHPFYAVKCNTDPAMVSLLAALGAGFDCASEWEADTVLGLGVPAERIVFANACKRPCDIRFAAAKGLKLTTFDTESELHKLARWHPSTETLLRIRADDTQVGLHYLRLFLLLQVAYLC